MIFLSFFSLIYLLELVAELVLACRETGGVDPVLVGEANRSLDGEDGDVIGKPLGLVPWVLRDLDDLILHVTLLLGALEGAGVILQNANFQQTG